MQSQGSKHPIESVAWLLRIPAMQVYNVEEKVRLKKSENIVLREKEHQEAQCFSQSMC